MLSNVLCLLVRRERLLVRMLENQAVPYSHRSYPTLVGTEKEEMDNKAHRRGAKIFKKNVYVDANYTSIMTLTVVFCQKNNLIKVVLK